MIEKHQGLEERAHTFWEAWEKLGRAGDQQLITRVGTPFVARAAVTTKGPRKGERVIRYFQKGHEYGRSYDCCWEHYYNCNRTRIGMYSTLVDEWIGSTGNRTKLTREELLKRIEQNGGPEGLDLRREDLSGLDLGKEAILRDLKARGMRESDDLPLWVYVVEGRPEGLDLRAARLDGASLQNANLEGANLAASQLIHATAQGTNFRRANLQGVNAWRAQLAGAELKFSDLRGANLYQAFMRGADLSNADLRTARLTKAFLQGASLQGAQLRGADFDDAYLKQARLQHAALQQVDLSGAQGLEGIYLYGARLERTNVARQQLTPRVGEEEDGEYLKAKEAYLRLKINFETLGRYADARWAYTKERRMERKSHQPGLALQYYGGAEVSRRLLGSTTLRGPGAHPFDYSGRAIRHYSRRRRQLRKMALLAFFHLTHSARWIASWIVDLVCGYGESISRALCSLVLLWFLAAVYYRMWWGVLGSNGGSVPSFRAYLVYSLGALTTTGFEHLRPRLDVGWVPTATALEALLGIFLTGLLGFVVANRIRRS